MSPLKVLFVPSGFFQVGDYFRYEALARGLAKRGHEVTVLTSDATVRLRAHHTSIAGVHWIRAPYLGGLGAAERLSNYLPETKLPHDVAYRVWYVLHNRHRFDVVHFFHLGWNTFLPTAALARLRSRECIVVVDWVDLWEGGIIEPPQSTAWRRLDYRLSIAPECRAPWIADAVTVNSSYLQQLARQLRRGSEHVAMVRDGTDPPDSQLIEKTAARATLQLPPNEIILGFSAYFHPDTLWLLRCVQIVARSHQVRLLLTGTQPEWVRLAITSMSLSDICIIAGDVAKTSLPIYLAACDVLLLPFRNRMVNLARWPIKLGTYLAAGRPVVAGDFGEVGEFFRRNPGIGVVCDSEDEAGFASAIGQLIANPQRRKAMGAAARRVAMTALAWDDSVSALEVLYRATLSARRAALDASNSAD